MPALKLKTNSLLLALMPLLLASACASPPMSGSADCPKPPSKPAARQPAPQQTYSASAASDTDSWQQQLTATLPTSGNAKQPGRSE